MLRFYSNKEEKKSNAHGLWLADLFHSSSIRNDGPDADSGQGGGLALAVKV